MLTELLDIVLEQQASDLHLVAQTSPYLRIHGELRVSDLPVVTAESLLHMLTSCMQPKQIELLQAGKEVDFAYRYGARRFRVNVFYQEGGVAASWRAIPQTVFTLQELGLPETILSVLNDGQGLILVTGPTGSGKSTTLASMIEHININAHKRIITIEDPIEFIYHNKNCLITQREVGRDSHSFDSALRAALRQDPDIILVGELRDLTTVRLALTAAETGHLVLATLHTQSAPQAISRLVDVCIAEDKALVRTLLAETLQLVVAQELLPKPGGGRVVATEVMLATPAIRNLIRENKLAQIYSVMQTGASLGMYTMEQNLQILRQKGI
jgi:twitching motility protein PilT